MPPSSRSRDPGRKDRKPIGKRPRPRNRGIRQCPRCQRSLRQIGSEVARLHPLVLFVDKHETALIGVAWLLATIETVMIGTSGSSHDRGIGFGWVSLLALPFVIPYFYGACSRSTESPAAPSAGIAMSSVSDALSPDDENAPPFFSVS